MERRHVPLMPAPPKEPQPSSEPPPVEPELKRRRVVSVACEECRRRKIRCDGYRPSCANCRGFPSPCVYRDNSPVPSNSSKLLLEVIQLLNKIPSEESARLIRSLRDESDARVILSALRGGTDARQRQQDASLAATVMGGTSQEDHLISHFPIAYLRLPHITAETLQEGPYDGLTRPSPVVFQAKLDAQQPAAESPMQSQQQARLPSNESAPPPLCDDRLRQLDIAHWTNVPISNEDAARVISLYMETDHPLMSHFEPRLFLNDLVSLESNYCSPLLVNSLLFWACQMYVTFDRSVEGLSLQFCEEAEEALDAHRDSAEADSALVLAALQFLSLGYMGQGRDHAVLRYMRDAIDTGERMGLFGVEDDGAMPKMAKMSNNEAINLLYAAWGTFNWVTLMSVFYRQPGIKCPRYAPRLPIPEAGSPSEPTSASDSRSTSESKRAPPRHGSDVEMSGLSSSSGPTQPWPPLPAYMGGLFPSLCRFWKIMHEVALVYYSSDTPLPDHMSAVRFSECKFRELLAWSNELPSSLLRSEKNPHYVQILHIWFHAAVLDIFRPYVKGSAAQGAPRLNTFPTSINTPSIMYAASVNQLKRLVIDYRLNYKSSTYSILWHTGLIYVANAVLQDTHSQGWLFFLLLCVYGYERLRRSWRVVESITAGLLSMTMRKGDISGDMARRIMSDLRQKSLGPMPGRIRATFMIDLELAMSDPESAKVETLASNFEDNAMFESYTNAFEER